MAKICLRKMKAWWRRRGWQSWAGFDQIEKRRIERRDRGEGQVEFNTLSNTEKCSMRRSGTRRLDNGRDCMRSTLGPGEGVTNGICES